MRHLVCHLRLPGEGSSAWDRAARSWMGNFAGRLHLRHAAGHRPERLAISLACVPDAEAGRLLTTGNYQQTTTMLGFAIVGCGMIARFHARALLDVPGTRLVALVSRNPAN